MQLRVLVACECSGRVREAFATRGWEAWSADLLPSETPAKYLAREIVDKWGLGYIVSHPRFIAPEGHMAAGYHYEGDCRDLFNWNHPVNYMRSALERQTPVWKPKVPLWDMIIGHPPCTDLSYAGARWFRFKDADRGGDGSMQRAAGFFMEIVNSPSPFVAVENPHCVMQTKRFYRLPDQVVNPYWFGDPYIKGIHLWLKGLPRLKATHGEADFPEMFRATTGGGSWTTDKTAGRKNMSAYEDSEKRINRAKVRSRTFPGLAREMASQWGDFAERYYREQGRC